MEVAFLVIVLESSWCTTNPGKPLSVGGFEMIYLLIVGSMNSIASLKTDMSQQG